MNDLFHVREIQNHFVADFTLKLELVHLNDSKLDDVINLHVFQFFSKLRDKVSPERRGVWPTCNRRVSVY